jgi:hypothetical protein
MDGDAVAAAAVESGRRRLQTIHNHLCSPPSGNPKPFPFLLFFLVFPRDLRIQVWVERLDGCRRIL